MAGEMTASGASAGTIISPGMGTVIGAGAGLVGDTISALLSSRASGKDAHRNREEARRQFNSQMDFQRNATQYRVEDALKAGINPLAALGVSSNVSPTISTGYGSGDSSWGNAASRAGDRIQNAIDRLTERDTEDEANYRKQSRALDLEGQRLQNEHLRLQNAVLSQPGVPDPVGTGEFLWRPVEDMDGNIRMVVNQDVLENDNDNAGYLASLVNAARNGWIDPTSASIGHQYKLFLDDQHYRATGRHLNTDVPWYVSDTELAIVAAEVGGKFLEMFKSRRKRK